MLVLQAAAADHRRSAAWPRLKIEEVRVVPAIAVKQRTVCRIGNRTPHHCGARLHCIVRKVALAHLLVGASG